MPRYRLDPERPEFDVVDGELAGRQYRHGAIYEEIPVAYRDRFVEVSEGAEAPPVNEEEEVGHE